MLFTILLLCAVPLCSGVQLQPPTISLLSPRGIEFRHPDIPGATLFAVHFSINTPISGVQVGQYNYDVTSKTGTEWVFSRSDILVKPGDSVHYWVYMLVNGQRYQITDQTWTAQGGITTTESSEPCETKCQPKMGREIMPLQAMFVSFLMLCAASFCSAQQLQQPTISLLQPQGIEFTHPDIIGASLFAVHFSINTPLPGVQAGQYNYDVNQKTGSEWVFQHTGIHVNPGDTVNYWILMVINGGGYQLIDQSWTAHSGTDPHTTNPPHVTTHHQPITTHNQPGTTPPVVTGEPFQDGYRLVMNDNFHNIDRNNWDYEVTASGGGNWEFQIYSPEEENTYVRDNVLYIKPTLTADRWDEDFLTMGLLDITAEFGYCTQAQWYGCVREGVNGLINPCMSGKLKSRVSIRYGKVEVIAKMPRGDWIWPAIWMLPTDTVYGTWPRSGEIDIVEARGNRNYGDIGIQHMGSTMHWGPQWDNNRYDLTGASYTAPQGTWADGFHKYELDWDETGIRISVDDHLVLNAPTPAGGYWNYGGFDGDNPWHNNDAPFDQDFYLIMNVAVGGTGGYFPDGISHKPWPNNSPTAPADFWADKNNWYGTWHGEDAAMQVQSVKMWQKI